MQAIKLLLILLFFHFPALAIDCRLAEMLRHPSIAKNDEFWKEFTTLDVVDDKALKALLKKYTDHFGQEPKTESKADSKTTAQTESKAGKASKSPIQSSTHAKKPQKSAVQPFSMSRTAEKALEKQNAKNKAHFDDFLKTINEEGTQALYDKPKKWQFKKTKGTTDKHTVRLDVGTRVLFEIKDGKIKILDIGNHINH